MKFFIPAAKDEQEAEQVYSSIKKFLSKEVGMDFDERRIYQLSYSHEEKIHSAEVGKICDFNHEMVNSYLLFPGE